MNDDPDPAAAWRTLAEDLAACEDFGALRRLSRRARKLAASSEPPWKRVPLRLAVVGGAMHDLLVDGLRLALLCRGVEAEIHVGGYGQFLRDLTDAGSAVAAFGPRVVVVVNTPFNVAAWPDLHASLEEAGELAERACEDLLGPARAFHERTGAEVVLNTLHTIPSTSVGHLGAKLPGDRLNFVRRVNLLLGDRAPPYVHLHDVAALAESRGLDAWFDERYWFHAKQPLAFGAAPEYVRSTAALVGALLGRTRKCVVVDLDNTLWGGVVGDDGVAHLVLGEGSAEGEAFKAFQTYLRRLKSRGTVLAVASKNDDATAREAFEQHPEMVLTLDDFVAFEANWGPKSDSLRKIAPDLDLGLDAFVFVDDNPAERALVRQELPEVAVPEVGQDPVGFPAAVDAGRYFEVSSLTAEDRKRTETYRSRRAASDAFESATDMESYLRSLEMVGAIAPFDPVSLPRITQLTNKTNQFNLTTRRVTLSEMQSFAASPDWVTRSLRLRDRFGDHGLVSVFFAERRGAQLVIEGWLMSCRVLKRGAEYALFEDVLAEARAAEVDEVIGVYEPTERNGMDLGFQEQDSGAGHTLWRLRVEGARAPEHFIRVADGGTSVGGGGT